MRPVPGPIDSPIAAPTDPPLLSFRDPGGRVVAVGDRIVRLVNRAGAANLDAFLGSRTARAFQDTRRLVATRVLDEDERRDVLTAVGATHAVDAGQVVSVLEHHPMAFSSYPHEWPAGMLWAAACLTLDLARSLLDEGLGLKDATPYNVMFDGPAPVFLDALSFERRSPHDRLWIPSAQFTRTFLLPLLTFKHFGIPPARLLLASPDGPEPEDVYALCGPLRRLRPAFLGTVTLPVWLGRAVRPRIRTTPGHAAGARDPEQVRFVLGALFRRLGRQTDRLRPGARTRSGWTAYAERACHYSAAAQARKADVVDAALADLAPRAVLDVGCNEGRYSVAAATRAACVVAIDRDEAVVGTLWRRAWSERLPILPLVVDVSRPTPALGWRNREMPSFAARARGAFDLVLMLAVLHHLLAADRVPLREVLAFVAELTRDAALLEFVPPTDPMFQMLGRGDLREFDGLTTGAFEDECRRHFRIMSAQPLPDSARSLYLLRKR